MQFYVVNMKLLGNLFQLQHISEQYENAILVGEFNFDFVSDQLQLVLEQTQTINNWIITPQSYPCTVRKYILIVSF